MAEDTKLGNIGLVLSLILPLGFLLFRLNPRIIQIFSLLSVPYLLPLFIIIVIIPVVSFIMCFIQIKKNSTRNSKIGIVLSSIEIIFAIIWILVSSVFILGLLGGDI